MESNYLRSNKRENIATKPFLQISLHDVNDANVVLSLQLTESGRRQSRYYNRTLTLFQFLQTFRIISSFWFYLLISDFNHHFICILLFSSPLLNSHIHCYFRSVNFQLTTRVFDPLFPLGMFDRPKRFQ